MPVEKKEPPSGKVTPQKETSKGDDQNDKKAAAPAPKKEEEEEEKPLPKAPKADKKAISEEDKEAVLQEGTKTNAIEGTTIKPKVVKQGTLQKILVDVMLCLIALVTRDKKRNIFYINIIRSYIFQNILNFIHKCFL